jgi:hypothetical protein
MAILPWVCSSPKFYHIFVICVVFLFLNNDLAKVYLAECTRKVYHPRVFSTIGLVWGLCNIVGPMIGGIYMHIKQ